MSLNKNQLNQFFKYYENIKLKEDNNNRLFGLLTFSSFNGGGGTIGDEVLSKKFLKKNLPLYKTATEAAKDIRADSPNDASRIAFEEISLNLKAYFIANKIWNEKYLSLGWFRIKNNIPDMNLKDSGLQPAGCILIAYLSDKIKNNLIKNLGNYLINNNLTFPLDLNTYLNNPYLEFEFYKGTSKNEGISYTGYQKKIKNLIPGQEAVNPSQYFNLYQKSKINNIIINFLNSDDKNNNQSTQPENLANYNTFTVMQINAAQKAIENFAIKNSKKIKSLLLSLIPNAAQHENLFSVNFICQQNNLTEKNESINKEILKEGQKMGTLFSRGTSEDKNTNLAEINFDITLQLLPSKNYDKLKDDEKKNINISFTKDANLLKNAEDVLKDFKNIFIRGLNSNKSLNKITYKDSVFYLKYKNEGNNLNIIPENTIKFSLKAYKTAPRNSATSVISKVVGAL